MAADALGEMSDKELQELLTRMDNVSKYARARLNKRQQTGPMSDRMRGLAAAFGQDAEGAKGKAMPIMAQQCPGGMAACDPAEWAKFGRRCPDPRRYASDPTIINTQGHICYASQDLQRVFKEGGVEVPTTVEGAIEWLARRIANAIRDNPSLVDELTRSALASGVYDAEPPKLAVTQMTDDEFIAFVNPVGKDGNAPPPEAVALAALFNKKVVENPKALPEQEDKKLLALAMKWADAQDKNAGRQMARAKLELKDTYMERIFTLLDTLEKIESKATESDHGLTPGNRERTKIAGFVPRVIGVWTHAFTSRLGGATHTWDRAKWTFSAVWPLVAKLRIGVRNDLLKAASTEWLLGESNGMKVKSTQSTLANGFSPATWNTMSNDNKVSFIVDQFRREGVVKVPFNADAVIAAVNNAE